MFVNTLVEGKIPVKALIDTSSKFNTVSKSLFDKLKEDYAVLYDSELDVGRITWYCVPAYS